MRCNWCRGVVRCRDVVKGVVKWRGVVKSKV